MIEGMREQRYFLIRQQSVSQSASSDLSAWEYDIQTRRNLARRRMWRVKGVDGKDETC